MQLTPRDRTRLEGVHPDLVRVIERAATLMPAGLRFMVIEGVRTPARQKELVRQGASQTRNSRHLTGHAVDLGALIDKDKDGAVDDIDWNEWRPWRALADFVLQAARLEGVPLEWGGNWRTLRDGPHYQLPWASYPVGSKVPKRGKPSIKA